MNTVDMEFTAEEKRKMKAAVEAARANERRQRGEKRSKRNLHYSREERRRLTLEAAKRAVKNYGMPRSQLRQVWSDLMMTFPKGTLE